MTILHIAALLVTLAALFSYVNHRYFKLPGAIGVMLISLVLSLCLLGLSRLGFGIQGFTRAVMAHIDFNETLLQGMLSFLLFAGALRIDLSELAKHKAYIGALATLGVALSTFLVGTGTYYCLRWAGMDLPYLACLLFGALISPTDPIAVLSMLKSARMPRGLEVKVAGESLFNDGIGIVLFTVLYGVFIHHRPAPISGAILLFVTQAIGGAALGWLLGLIVYGLLKSADKDEVGILLTLALVMGGYDLASLLDTSGPIAMVVAGLFIGNQGRAFAMSESTRARLDAFWELLDEIFNAVLFVLIGLEVLALSFSGRYWLASLMIIPIVLLARAASIFASAALLRRWEELSRGTLEIMIWGGLRGGLSVALALSLPPGPHRKPLLAVTYAVVVFSILVQGLTIKFVIPKKA